MMPKDKMKLFDQVLEYLHQFKLDKPFTSEASIEKLVLEYLISKQLKAKTQQKSHNKRYDLICSNGNETICIELKITAETSNVKQFDKYHLDFPHGFIILCWNATKPFKEIFNSVKEQSPTPIALVELSRRHSMI